MRYSFFIQIDQMKFLQPSGLQFHRIISKLLFLINSIRLVFDTDAKFCGLRQINIHPSIGVYCPGSFFKFDFGFRQIILEFLPAIIIEVR